MYSSTHDLLVLTETWLSQEFLGNELLPTVFFIYCNDRASRGGGVLIAINNYIPYVLLATPSGLEVLMVEVQCKLALFFVFTFLLT